MEPSKQNTAQPKGTDKRKIKAESRDNGEGVSKDTDNPWQLSKMWISLFTDESQNGPHPPEPTSKSCNVIPLKYTEVLWKLMELATEVNLPLKALITGNNHQAL